MNKINDYMFVFYWRSPKSKYIENPERWRVSQPVTLGELIEGRVELDLDDNSSLPIDDIDWADDEVRAVLVPPRTYIHDNKEIK